MDLLDKISLYTFDGTYKDEVSEETAWQTHIKKELDGRSLGSMDDEETKKFFKDAKASFKGSTNEDKKEEDEDESKEHEDSESEEEEKEEHKKKVDEATGAEIAAKMEKSKTMKGFAKKVAKMKTVTKDDLEEMLPDFVAGKDIQALF